MPNGNGLQNVYLAQVSSAFAAVIFRHVGSEVHNIQDVAMAVATAERESPAPDPLVEEWDTRVERQIASSKDVPETERLALIQARRGQGKFRQNVQFIERFCRLTRVSRSEHLIASHIKPWRVGSNDERLDGENGLLLTPSVDHLFDKGFISFEDRGRLIVSPVADLESLKKMGVNAKLSPNVGVFSEGQRRFLDYHRNNTLMLAQRGTG